MGERIDGCGRRKRGLRACLGVVVAMALSALLSMWGCASMQKTPGQQFRELMERMAEICAEQKLPPTDSRCVLPTLQPAEPLATPEGRFAHSLDIPNPVSEDSGYKPGMTSEEYFEHLCRTEAGEIIFRAAPGVEGIYQMRPRDEAQERTRGHLYAQEDPYGYQRWEIRNPQDRLVQPPLGKYRFLELPLRGKSIQQGEPRHLRYYRGMPEDSQTEFVYMEDGHSARTAYLVKEKVVTAVESRFAYTWRGVDRSADRELGIAGGELIILDRTSGEVLAVRRGFVWGGIDSSIGRFSWRKRCPTTDDVQFLYRVLMPGTVQSDQEE